MKKATLILWVIAAAFLLSSIPLFGQGNIAAGACGVVIAAVLFYVGLRKKQSNEKTEAKESAAIPPNSAETYKVYIEKDGKKYHHSKTCSGMKNPKYVSLSYALKKGYTECKKCSR